MKLICVLGTRCDVSTPPLVPKEETGPFAQERLNIAEIVAIIAHPLGFTDFTKSLYQKII